MFTRLFLRCVALGLGLGAVACSGAALAPNEAAPVDALDTGDESAVGKAESALSTSGAASEAVARSVLVEPRIPIDPRIFEWARCGDSPIATTVVDYEPGSQPWSNPREEVVLVELASRVPGTHDVVAVRVRPDETEFPVLGRVRVTDERFRCFAASFGRWIGYARDYDFTQILFGRANFAQAMTTPGNTPTTGSCVVRVLPSPSSSGDLLGYPDSCVAGSVTGAALVAVAINGTRTDEHSCGCPSVLVRIPRRELPHLIVR